MMSSNVSPSPIAVHFPQDTSVVAHGGPNQCCFWGSGISRKATAQPQLATLPKRGCTGPLVLPQTSETKTLPQTSMEISLKRKENNQTFFKKKKNPCFEIFGFFFSFLFNEKKNWSNWFHCVPFMWPQWQSFLPWEHIDTLPALY